MSQNSAYFSSNLDIETVIPATQLNLNSHIENVSDWFDNLVQVTIDSHDYSIIIIEGNAASNLYEIHPESDFQISNVHSLSQNRKRSADSNNQESVSAKIPRLQDIALASLQIQIEQYIPIIIQPIPDDDILNDLLHYHLEDNNEIPLALLEASITSPLGNPPCPEELYEDYCDFLANLK